MAYEKLEVYLIAADVTEGKKQRRPIFKYRRATKVLTREQAKAIKKGRKVLRKEMKAKGLKSKEDFELTATNMGLYFDKSRFLVWLEWLLHGRGLWALAGALAALMLTLFAYATITQLQGHFTVNMSDGLFSEGFSLCETRDFANPVPQLFCTPAENVPCVSIANLPEFLDNIDGQHNASYFAYTFYCRNEGESTVDYEWQVNINSESNELSEACWVMVFEDSQMLFYAKPNQRTGEVEALPAIGDNSRGYVQRPLAKYSADPERQYEVITERNGYVFSRVLPIPFISDYVVAQGTQTRVRPQEIHKYTVVIWLEGDDPDCTDELIGGHLGMEIFFQMVGEEAGQVAGGNSFDGHWDKLWKNLRFWKD